MVKVLAIGWGMTAGIIASDKIYAAPCCYAPRVFMQRVISGKAVSRRWNHDRGHDIWKDDTAGDVPRCSVMPIRIHPPQLLS